MAAGSGAAAVAHLSDSSEAKSGMTPQPPTSTPSGRPKGAQRREVGTTDSGQQMWQDIFQEIAGHDNTISKEDSVKCAALASMCQVVTSEVVTVCLASGFQEADVRRVLKENIFKSAPNPQDGADASKKQVVRCRRSSDGDTPQEPQENSFEPLGDSVMKTKSDKCPIMGPRASLHTHTVRSIVPDKSNPSASCNTKLKLDTSNMCRHLESHPSEVYDMGHVLGAGTFGSVLKARHRQTGQIHALKSVPKHMVQLEALWDEIDIMKQLDHPHIMRLYYTFEDEGFVYMASEMCGGGELYDTLDETGFFPEGIAVILMRQILSTLNYLHSSKSIAHRDLKPENFLVLQKGNHENLHLKLIDFGTAKRFDQTPLTTKVCTVHYVAPEVLKRGDIPYTEKVDVWSCGVILYMMLCGFMPFHHDDDKEILKIVKKGKFVFSPERVWHLISDGAKNLITGMMTKNVEDRLTATQAFQHDWIQTKEVNAQELSCQTDDIVKSMRQFLTNNRLKRVALQIIARQTCDAGITKLRDIFKDIDKDNSGAVTAEEMDKAFMAWGGTETTRQEMRSVMRGLDVEGTGELEYTEFLATMLKRDQYLQDDVCRGAFHLLDTDGDGTVSSEDLQSLLANAGHGVTLSKAAIEEIDQILHEVDENGDGGVSFEEFWNIMKEDGPTASSTAVSLRWQRGNARRTDLERDNLLEGVTEEDEQAAQGGKSP